MGSEMCIRDRSSSFEMVRGMVGHGLGFAVMMTKPASSVTYDGMPVVARALDIEFAKGHVVLASRKDETLDATVEQARALAIEFCTMQGA